MRFKITPGFVNESNRWNILELLKNALYYVFAPQGGMASCHEE
jgi:hypothetical protein